MSRIVIIISGVILLVAAAITGYADDAVLLKRIDKILSKGPEHDNYHVTAMQVSDWMKKGKKDFQVIDVRMPPDDGQWGKPEFGRIPGSLYIPYTELFKPENLRKLPKNKKLILVGHMSVYENYLVIPLRLTGYEAYIMLMGMSGWQKDYPAVGHVTMLINAASTKDFPLLKEAEGGMPHHHRKRGHTE